MSLSDQIAIGQQKIDLLMQGLQELNEEILMQEEANTLMSITQTFDLLIQILVERKENLLLETKEIYEGAFAGVYQRRKDAQSMIESLQKLEEECKTATDKPLYQAEAEIQSIKRRYDDLLLAANEQLADIGNPVCSFELEQDTILSGLLDISNEVDELSKKDKLQKRPLSKSHSQSINNGNFSSSPDLETERPNTAANLIGSNTPTLSSPEKHRKNALKSVSKMREYSREPSGHKSTPILDRLEHSHIEQQFDNSARRNTTHVPLERSKLVNGEKPFLRKSIAQDKLVIQTNYPNSHIHGNYCSPQLPSKGASVKTHKSGRKSNGDMEGAAVGLGVRRVNSCDHAELIESNTTHKYRSKENSGRRLTPQCSIDIEANNTGCANGKRRNSKNILQAYKSKRSDATSVREMFRTFSLNSKQKIFTETKI